MNPSAKERMTQSLRGLSIGDALGRQAFMENRLIHDKVPPSSTWRYTDDTRMALALVHNLLAHDAIDVDELATQFGQDFLKEPERGYGAVAHFILHQIAHGMPWQEASTLVYNGQGSKGNGAAMRVAPLGAYFADRPELIMEQAKTSALPTHAHPEGIAGAQLIAWTTSVLLNAPNEDASSLFSLIMERTTGNVLHPQLKLAASLEAYDPKAGVCLGAGEYILAQDTVPLAVWLAVHHRHNFEQAILATIKACPSPAADVDTLCAIVGGMVAPLCFETIPSAWMDAVESYSLS